MASEPRNIASLSEVQEIFDQKKNQSKHVVVMYFYDDRNDENPCKLNNKAWLADYCIFVTIQKWHANPELLEAMEAQFGKLAGPILFFYLGDRFTDPDHMVTPAEDYAENLFENDMKYPFIDSIGGATYPNASDEIMAKIQKS